MLYHCEGRLRNVLTRLEQGEGICCYVTLKEHVQESEDLVQDLRMTVRHSIGALATPDYVIITSALPKTRSGKIMRRLLRKVIAGEVSGHFCTKEFRVPFH